MTRRELASRYAGSAIGVVWAYLQPLLTVAAYILVFDVVFSMRTGTAGVKADSLGVYLVAGAIPWLAFCETVSRGASSLVEAGSLLQKNALPPVLFVARSVFAGLVVYAPLTVFILFGFMLRNGIAPAHWAVLPLILIQGLMALLLGYILAILSAAVRDVLQVLTFLLSVGIYLSPVLFPVTLFPEAWRWVLFANPMSAIVMAYHTALLNSEWPAGELWIIMFAWLAVLLIALNGFIRRSRDVLVDWL